MFDFAGKYARVALVAAAGLMVTVFAVPASANHVAGNLEELDHGARLVIPMMSPDRGKDLFVDKGCIACHAINGVGGHDAPAMDAHRDMGLVNPFDLAAKMWNHAPGMIAAQQAAFGEQIYFTGEELADIIAFLHNHEAQHGFSEADLTAEARAKMHHDHGGAKAVDAHAKEVGHSH
ncbi:MAG: c-type cytochrome [Rhodospirillales bacterium]|nr:MAG: c-type cytochrome [Rhodospirillales bacterium]